MGWWTATKKAATATGRAIKGKAGKIARGSAVAAAGVAGSLVPGCGPVCGFVAAAATDELLGGPIERGTRRAIDRTGQAADDFIDYLDGGPSAQRPPGMATTVSGTSAASVVKGSADDKVVDYTIPLAIAGAATTTAIVAVWALHRTGRL